MLEKCPPTVREGECEPNLMRSLSQSRGVRLRGRAQGPRVSSKRLRNIPYPAGRPGVRNILSDASGQHPL